MQSLLDYCKEFDFILGDKNSLEGLLKHIKF